MQHKYIYIVSQYKFMMHDLVGMNVIQAACFWFKDFTIFDLLWTGYRNEQKLQWDSLQQRRAHNRVLMLYQIHNDWLPFLPHSYLQPTVVHSRGFETNYRQIQCNTSMYSQTFFLVQSVYGTTCQLMSASCRPTASWLN